MKDKRHTQLQRIKFNETVIGTLWAILKKQGEEISNINLLLKELSDNNKKKD
jgi:hypothetical protein